MEENLFEKIEDYLHGGMSREEQLSFESELKKSEELKMAVAIYKRVETDMRNNLKNTDDEILLKKTLQGLGNQYFKNVNKEILIEYNKTKPNNETNANKVKILFYVSVAAAFIVIIGFGITYYFNSAKKANLFATYSKIADTVKIASSSDSTISKSDLHAQTVKTEAKRMENINNKLHIKIKSKDMETLFAENFKPDQLPVIKSGPLKTAFAQYENKKYEDAIAAIDDANINIVTRGEETDISINTFYASYYKALSYMALNKGEKAIPELEKARTLQVLPKMEIRVKWYLALAYLQIGKLNKVEKILEEIALSKSGIFSDSASHLRNEIKDIK